MLPSETQKTLPLRRWIKIVIFALLFFVSIALWLQTLTFHSQYVRGPAVSLQFPRFLATVVVRDNGLHFLGIVDDRFDVLHGLLGIYVAETYDLGPTYHHGMVVNLLGWMVVILPYTFFGGDYSVPPHAAMVFPYWLLIVGSGWGFLRVSGRGTSIKALLVVSRKSWLAMAGVGAFYFVLNYIPSASRPGSMIRPGNFQEFFLLYLAPWWFPEPGLELSYGFPFVFFRWAFINGKWVNNFFGDDTLGLLQHRFMENLCFGLAAMALAGMVVHFFGEVCSEAKKLVDKGSSN